MNAIREIMTREAFAHYEVPEEMGEVFEVIIVPVNRQEKNGERDREGNILMKYQEENGFSKNVLAQESEDVWNDI